MLTKFDNNKILISLSIALVCFFLSAYFWNKIAIPYNQDNLILGNYSTNKFNPINEILRFIAIIVIPGLIYLACIIRLNNNTYSLHPKNREYFLFEEKNDKNNFNSKKIFSFFLIYLILEFFLLDFNQFISLEFYHDGGFLVAPKNFLNFNSINSTFYDYGFLGNNIGLLSHYLFDYYSPGSIKITKIVLIFLIKFLLLLLSKEIVSNLHFNYRFKQIFFFIFGFVLINLPNYYDMSEYFTERMFFYFIFLMFLIVAFLGKKYSKLNFFITGTFSLTCILWWWDIGIYTNALILITSFILITQKKFLELCLLYLGVIFSWIILFMLLPATEIFDYLSDLTEYIFKASYVMGIEYKQPFSDGSTRWTKALLIIFLVTVLLINLNFIKKFRANYSLRISLNLIFISSLLFFNSALVRSDAGHIRYASGMYTLLFVFLVLYFIFFKLENSKFSENIFNFFNEIFKKKYSKLILYLLILTTISINNNLLFEKFSRIKNFKNNFYHLATLEDDKFLEVEHLQNINKKFKYKDIINFYKNISKDDKCVQVLTADVSFPYFLNKPTCTKFYNTVGIITRNSEKKFISQLSSSKPKILLFDSPIKYLPTIKNQENMTYVFQYIEKNYQFYRNYQGFVFYKKINSQN